jgi:hypothetical protein
VGGVTASRTALSRRGETPMKCSRRHCEPTASARRMGALVPAGRVFLSTLNLFSFFLRA